MCMLAYLWFGIHMQQQLSMLRGKRFQSAADPACHLIHIRCMQFPEICSEDKDDKDKDSPLQGFSTMSSNITYSKLDQG